MSCRLQREQIGQRDPAPPRQADPRIPRDLETIILKTLAKRPADRYATAAEMVRALQEARRKAFPGGRTPAPGRAPAPARPPGIQDLLADAERLVAAGRLAEAQAVLRRAVDVDPHSAVAFRRLFEVAAAIAETNAGEAE